MLLVRRDSGKREKIMSQKFQRQMVGIMQWECPGGSSRKVTRIEPIVSSSWGQMALVGELPKTPETPRKASDE